MAKIHYFIVPHVRGWTYKLGDVFAETFGTHAEAVKAAQVAAARQQIAGDTVEIRWQDIGGGWHEERADGKDRPVADVIDRKG